MDWWMHQLDVWALQLGQLAQQLQQGFHQLQQWIHQQAVEQIYAAFAVLIITLCFFLCLHLFKQKRNDIIVLAGLSGSGKTTLFYQLQDGSPHQGTVTSMEPNEGSFVLNSESAKKGKVKPVHLVDFPGHSRLLPKLDKFLPEASGLVFVVDAVDFLPNCQATAEYLFDILTKATVVKRKIPVLVLCNKTDKVTAHTKEFIRKQLEKEMDKLRASRTAVSSADIASKFTLGIAGQPFSFSQCLNEVTLGEASGLKGEISQLEEFIREHVQL